MGGSAVWAWATSDFWETGPVVAGSILAGVMAGSAVFVQRRRVPSAVILALLVIVANLVVVAMVTVARWAR
jgi:hypothetical protein